MAVHNLLGHGDACVIYGKPGDGKSFLVGRVRSPSWQQELTPAVTAMDAAKLGMAPMEGTCRAGR
jgi:hypothetical protein